MDYREAEVVDLTAKRLFACSLWKSCQKLQRFSLPEQSFHATSKIRFSFANLLTFKSADSNASVHEVSSMMCLQPGSMLHLLPRYNQLTMVPFIVSVISFAEARYRIVEPLTPRRIQWLSIPVLRTGNLTRSDIVRVITKDGTAKSGQDYEAVDTGLIYIAALLSNVS